MGWGTGGEKLRLGGEKRGGVWVRVWVWVWVLLFVDWGQAEFEVSFSFSIIPFPGLSRARVWVWVWVWARPLPYPRPQPRQPPPIPVPIPTPLPRQRQCQIKRHTAHKRPPQSPAFHPLFAFPLPLHNLPKPPLKNSLQKPHRPQTNQHRVPRQHGQQQHDLLTN